MTDEATRIVNALRCHWHDDCLYDMCKYNECNYYDLGCEYMRINKDAADLIERLSEEIELRMQKPLTLEEACGSEELCVFLEQRRLQEPYFVPSVLQAITENLCEAYAMRRRCDGECVMGHTYLPMHMYGKAWRCWAAKPTDEERKAAKWDD